jgi:hypothetical protein
MTVSERLYAAVPTEQMVTAFSAELVVRQLAVQQTKGVGLDDHTPPPDFGAERAVALAGTCAQIDIHLIADCPTVTTSNVCFLYW